MMNRTLPIVSILLSILAAAPLARAEDSFEAKAVGAVRVPHIESLVWALTAPCDTGDDVQQRQCRHIRDTRAAELTTATLIVDADPAAFEIGAWNPQKKSVPITLSSCVRCTGVDVDGKTWYVIASTTPPQFAGGKVKTGTLHDNARTFTDAASAKQWTKAVANAKVQLLVKVPAKPKWVVDGKPGLALEVLGYRVFTPCDGGIVCSSPKSGPANADKKQCGPVASGATAAADEPKLESLTPELIQEAMKPVRDAGLMCFMQFGAKGTAKLKLTVAGDGSVASYAQEGDFVGTPTEKCIDKAVSAVQFPPTKRPKTAITYPLALQ